MQQTLQVFKKCSILLCFFALIACDNTPNLQRAQGDALGTSYSILYLDTAPNTVLLDSIDAVFLRINQSMSTYWPNSLISKVNRGESVQIDTDFKRVYNAAILVWDQTDGYFDPTVGALVNAYGFGPTKPLKQIGAKVIDSLMMLTGFSKVALTEKGFIKKQHPNIFIDYNAIAKGYAVDMLTEALVSLNYTDFLIEVGGELYAKGTHPVKNLPWRVAIDHPKQDVFRQFIATLPLENQALASSGNYRKFRIDAAGNRYVHTINPMTGHPVKSEVLSTSVRAASTMLADAYATALMAMPYNEGKVLINNLERVEALWVLAVNDTVRITATAGFEFTLE